MHFCEYRNKSELMHFEIMTVAQNTDIRYYLQKLLEYL